jgi:hypothetical protein
MMKIQPAIVLFLSGIACLLSSCASISVKEVRDTDTAKPRAKPARIYVEPFGFEHAVVKEHPMRKNPGSLKTETQDLLAKYLVQELTKKFAPATLVKRGSAPRSGGWLVSGEFTRINEGSRAMRVSFGLGLGGTKIETRVAVRNLPAKNKPFLAFETTGGSGASPGGITNPIPFSGAATALITSKNGITDDSARTARMITAEIAQYAVKRGWVPAESAPTVKHVSKFSIQGKPPSQPSGR